MFLVHRILFLCQGFRSIFLEQTHQWSPQHQVLQFQFPQPLAVLDQRTVAANNVLIVHLRQRTVAANYDVQSDCIEEVNQTAAANYDVQSDRIGEVNQKVAANYDVQSDRIGEVNQPIAANYDVPSDHIEEVNQMVAANNILSDRGEVNQTVADNNVQGVRLGEANQTQTVLAGLVILG
ncbi:unnamed protein product [Urochloa humidicola]